MIIWKKSRAIRLLATVLLVTCLDSCSLFGFRNGNKEREDPPIESLGDYQLEVGKTAFLELYEGGRSVLTADLTVDLAGNLNVPEVGEVSVEGMAPLSAAKKIEFMARKADQNHLSGPRVHIKALDRRAVVHVSGLVLQAGPVTFHPGLTVVEAVAAAGGVTEEANASAVSLTSEGRKSIVTTLETRELREGDVINIPRRL